MKKTPSKPKQKKTATKPKGYADSPIEQNIIPFCKTDPEFDNLNPYIKKITATIIQRLSQNYEGLIAEIIRNAVEHPNLTTLQALVFDYEEAEGHDAYIASRAIHEALERAIQERNNPQAFLKSNEDDPIDQIETKYSQDDNKNLQAMGPELKRITWRLIDAIASEYIDKISTLINEVMHDTQLAAVQNLLFDGNETPKLSIYIANQTLKEALELALDNPNTWDDI